MKKLLLLSLLIANICYGQNRTVDINDPISDIDISYTEQNGVTRLTVILNSIEVTQNEINTASTYTADINIKGLIYWDTEQLNSKKYILKNTKLSKEGSDKPFVLFADLYDGSNSLLMQPTKKDNWEKISFKLYYVINGKTGQTPTLNLYPPKDNASPVTRTINISTSATQKELKKGIIGLKSIPSGTPFEITELEIKKVSGSNTTTTKLNESTLSTNRFSYNGELNLMINTLFDIETINAKYYVKCRARMIGNPDVIFSNAETEVVFVPNFDLKVLNRKSGYSIILPSGANFYLDENIETEGNGELGIRFLNSNYQHIRSDISGQSNGKYNIKLEGLQEIPSETSSTYFYTNGAKDISSPLIISKKLPRVTDFKFNGVKGDSILMSFKLPGIDKGVQPSITLSGEKGAINLGGNVVVKRDKKDDNKFDVYIDRKISNLISKDDIVKDVSIGIDYGGNTLYGLTVTVFNQKLYDQKMTELKSETDKKKKERDPEKIKKLVEDIVEIGTAIGNSIEDEEVNSAIEDLQTAKGDKVKAVMSDIGKWALVAGKIILPLLAI